MATALARRKIVPDFLREILKVARLAEGDEGDDGDAKRDDVFG